VKNVLLAKPCVLLASSQKPFVSKLANCIIIQQGFNDNQKETAGYKPARENAKPLRIQRL